MICKHFPSGADRGGRAAGQADCGLAWLPRMARGEREGQRGDGCGAAAKSGPGQTHRHDGGRPGMRRLPILVEDGGDKAGCCEKGGGVNGRGVAGDPGPETAHHYEGAAQVSLVRGSGGN